MLIKYWQAKKYFDLMASLVKEHGSNCDYLLLAQYEMAKYEYEYFTNELYKYLRYVLTYCGTLVIIYFLYQWRII